jgi:hypothetical protein
MDRRRVTIALLVPLSIGIFIAIGLFAIGHDLPALAHRGTSTQGTVTAKQPLIHSSFVYQYHVRGATYSGSVSVPDLDRIHIGDPVAVTYLPHRPSVSVAGDAEAIYRSWLHALAMVPTAITLISAALALGVELLRTHLTRR